MGKKHSPFLFLTVSVSICVLFLLSNASPVWADAGTPCTINTNCWDSATDNDGGIAPKTQGVCKEYHDTCVDKKCKGEFTTVNFPDSCQSSVNLYEYYPSGIYCSYVGSLCNDFDNTPACGGSGNPCPGCFYYDWSCTGSGTVSNPGYCDDTAINPDTPPSTYCTSCGKPWGIGGEGAGASACCGDDSSENVLTCTATTLIAWKTSSCDGRTACCNPSTDCNTDDNCYATGSDYQVSSGVDQWAYCGSGHTWYDCDNYPTSCSVCGYASTTCGEALSECSKGQTECCGDDENEYKNTCNTVSTVDWTCSVTACCNPSTDCVQPDYTCSNTQEAHKTQTSGNDMWAYCGSDIKWHDCDTYYSDCGASVCGSASGVKCGETFDECVKGQTECCGDDSTEDYAYCQKDSAITWSCSSSDTACCNNPSNCVDPTDPTCHTSSRGHDVDASSSIDNYAYCDGSTQPGTWKDCDSYPTSVGCNCAQQAAIRCGESGFGECNLGEMECCGDDSGENYRYCEAAAGFPAVAGDCASSDSACCNSATDCVTTDGSTCVTSGSTSVDGDGNGDNDYCNAGTWYDCSDATNNQCPVGYMCSVSDDCVLDTTPPTVSVSGAPASWQKTDATASVVCSDSYSGCDVTSYKLLTYASNPGSCPTTYSSYTLTSPQTVSSHVWVCAAAKDNAGNDGFSSPTEFKVDKTLPVTSITCNGAACASSWYTANVAIVLSCTDTGGSGCASTYYCVDQSDACTPSTAYSSSFAVSTEGTNYVRYYSTDAATNAEAVKSQTVRLDKSAPTVSVSGAPSNWQNTDASAAVSCSDPYSGCDAATYRLRSSSSNPGACSQTYADYTLTSPQTISSHQWLCAAAKDAASNTGFSTPSEFRIDKINPVASITDESTIWISSDVITLSCTDTGDSACVTTKWYYFDADGVCATTKASYTLSTTAATITVNTNHNDWLCLWVEDNAGNHDTDVSSQLLVDVNAPSTVIDEDGGDYTGYNVTAFNLTCSDTGGSGCNKTYYKIVNATDSCGTTGFTVVSAGFVKDNVTCPFGQTCDLKVCYYSNDRANNFETLKQSNSFHLKTNACQGKQCGDACLYTQGICDGPDGNCYASGGCRLACTAPSPGTGNERIWVTSACGRTGSYKCAASSICSNSLVSCSVGGSSAPVTGDWVSYSYPTGSYGTGGSFSIALSGVSKSPLGFTILSECAVVKSNGSVVYFDNWGTNVLFSYTVRPEDPEGMWTVDYCGLWSDFEGNGGWLLKRNDTNYQFAVDKSPPSITINRPKTNDVYSADFTANATVSDTYSSIDKVFYRWENTTSTGAWVGMALSGGEYTANFDVDVMADGVYSVRVRANDSVGNSGNASVSNVRIDRQAPDITIFSPASGWHNANFSVTARVTDNDAVDHVRYRWENLTNSGPWNKMSQDASGNYTGDF